MDEELYQKLAEHLDNLPAGYPRTESGVELRILRRLFTPDEAELALHLTLLQEEPRVVARRARLPLEVVEQRLDEMSKKGLVYSHHPKDGPPRYMATQYAVGIWEFQVRNQDAEAARDYEEYLPKYLPPEIWKKGPQLRTIPVGESITARQEVMAYEQAEALVRAQKKFVVAPCICRKERELMGHHCDKPREVCLSFGNVAEYYQRNGLGREIDLEETLNILKLASDAGLVLQPANSKKATFICCCCGDCCAVLVNAKRHPKPASILASPFFVAHNPDTCASCALCEMRCQMEAIDVDYGTPVVNLDRCIGCGLCISTCPTGSLSLIRKPKSEQPRVPRSTAETMIVLGRARGKLTPGNLAMLVVRSKVDRLLA